GIALNRSRRDFTERDRFILGLVRPHLVQGFENARCVTQMLGELAVNRQALEDSGCGLVIMNGQGLVRSMSRQAELSIAKYFPGSAKRVGHLQEILRRWIKHEHLSADETTFTRPRTPLVIKQEGHRLVARLLSNPDETVLL